MRLVKKNSQPRTLGRLCDSHVTKRISSHKPDQQQPDTPASAPRTRGLYAFRTTRIAPEPPHPRRTSALFQPPPAGHRAPASKVMGRPFGLGIGLAPLGAGPGRRKAVTFFGQVGDSVLRLLVDRQRQHLQGPWPGARARKPPSTGFARHKTGKCWTTNRPATACHGCWRRQSWPRSTRSMGGTVSTVPSAGSGGALASSAAAETGCASAVPPIEPHGAGRQHPKPDHRAGSSGHLGGMSHPHPESGSEQAAWECSKIRISREHKRLMMNFNPPCDHSDLRQIGAPWAMRHNSGLPPSFRTN